VLGLSTDTGSPALRPGFEQLPSAIRLGPSIGRPDDDDALTLGM